MGTLAIGLNALLLAAATFGLARHVASDAVRVRNALLLRRARPGDFEWTPERLPADFRLNTATPRKWVLEVLREIGVARESGAWERAVLIAAHLSEHAQDKGRIRADLRTTYRRIRAGYGYCADFAHVFLALGHAAGIFVRQWAFSFDGFGGHGHVFVEVYDPQRKQWIFIDVYNNVHAIDPASRRPLSALELRRWLQENRSFPKIVRNGPGRLGFPREEKLAAYYLRGLQEWYLWWGAPFQFYAPLVGKGAAGARIRIAQPALRVLASLATRIQVYETGENLAQVARLAELRRRLLGSALLCATLCAVLLVQLSTSTRWLSIDTGGAAHSTRMPVASTTSGAEAGARD